MVHMSHGSLAHAANMSMGPSFNPPASGTSELRDQCPLRWSSSCYLVYADIPIMQLAGLEVRRYRYLDRQRNSLDLEGLIEDIVAAPRCEMQCAEWGRTGPTVTGGYRDRCRHQDRPSHVPVLTCMCECAVETV